MSAQQQDVAIITKAEVRAAEAERRSVKARIGERYGIDPEILMGTLRSTVFKGDVSTEQLIMLLVVADQHKLNPFTKEIYAFPSRQGIVPVVGVDGWARIINEHPEFDGMDFEQDDEKCTCRMYRKDRGHPTVVTEYLAECKRPTDPWTSHPKRMLRHKAMIQCARIAFSFAGIYDPDEAERIVAAEPVDVTPGQEVIPAGKKVGPKKLREIVDGMLEAVKAGDGKALLAIWNSMDNEQQLFVWNELRSWERSAIKKLRDEAMKADQGMQLDSWSISLLKECETEEALQKAYKAVTEAYEANSAEVPESVVLVCDEMRMSMGAA